MTLMSVRYGTGACREPIIDGVEVPSRMSRGFLAMVKLSFVRRYFHVLERFSGNA